MYAIWRNLQAGLETELARSPRIQSTTSKRLQNMGFHLRHHSSETFHQSQNLQVALS